MNDALELDRLIVDVPAFKVRFDPVIVKPAVGAIEGQLRKQRRKRSAIATGARGRVLEPQFAIFHSECTHLETLSRS